MADLALHISQTQLWRYAVLGSKIGRIVAAAGGSVGVLLAAAAPSVATNMSPDGADVSDYYVTAPANVHQSPTHGSPVLRVKHTGDIVTSPLPQCTGVWDGSTLWIEVNLSDSSEGWMGAGQLSPSCQ